MGLISFIPFIRNTAKPVNTRVKWHQKNKESSISLLKTILSVESLCWQLTSYTTPHLCLAPFFKNKTQTKIQTPNILKLFNIYLNLKKNPKTSEVTSQFIIFLCTMVKDLISANSDYSPQVKGRPEASAVNGSKYMYFF